MACGMDRFFDIVITDGADGIDMDFVASDLGAESAGKTQTRLRSKERSAEHAVAQEGTRTYHRRQDSGETGKQREERRARSRAAKAASASVVPPMVKAKPQVVAPKLKARREPEKRVTDDDHVTGNVPPLRKRPEYVYERPR